MNIKKSGKYCSEWTSLCILNQLCKINHWLKYLKVESLRRFCPCNICKRVLFDYMMGFVNFLHKQWWNYFHGFICGLRLCILMTENHSFFLNFVKFALPRKNVFSAQFLLRLYGLFSHTNTFSIGSKMKRHVSLHFLCIF